MSIFGTGAASTNVEAEKDFSKRTLDTGAYSGTLGMVFVGQAQSGARNVTVHVNLDNGKKLTETVYITNKTGQNTYEKDGKHFHLPGFQLINNLAVMTTGKGLFDLAADVETRSVKLYDFTAKAEVLQDVQAVIPMIGQRVLLAVQEEEKEKQKKNDATGNYEGTGEFTLINSIVKCFDPETTQSAVEKANGQEAAALEAWLKTNKGKVKEAKKAATPANQASHTATNKPSGLFG
ncbi:ssDNA binding protein [Acinetobacter phage nACB1]|nr:ssDNA binding protein [Acinetobacter phage nACB1]